MVKCKACHDLGIVSLLQKSLDLKSGLRADGCSGYVCTVESEGEGKLARK